MKRSLINSLSEREARVLAETEREALTTLGEDELLSLHERARRARNKYTKLYRRRASARVGPSGGRGHAHAKNQRNRDKAELFELALARVSRQVEVVAQQAADELRETRIAAARARPGGPEHRGGPAVAEARGSDTRRKHRKTTGGLKRDASTRATGARRQATRDSR